MATSLKIPFKIPSPVIYLLVFLPAITSFIFIGRYAVNIPCQDDYDAILQFLCTWKAAPGADKISLLFLQQNEHRILSSRIVYVLYDAIAGNINFRALIFAGNLQLLLTFLILISFVKKALPRYWAAASFVAGLCLFDINNWENAGFAMAAMQNYGVLFLFAASLFFYSLNGKWYWIAAVCLQAILTFSSGNGIPASAFLVLFTILNRYANGADGCDGGRLSAWCGTLAATAVFLICSPLYFLHYRHATQAAIAAPAKIIAWFFRFAGQHIYYDNDELSVFAGVAVLLLLAITILFKFKAGLKSHLAPLICIAGFLVSSMALAALFRAGQGDYIPSRYDIYPHLLMAVLFTCVMVKLKDKKAARPIALLFTVLMLIAYNMNSRGGKKGFENLNAALKNTDYYYPDKRSAQQIAGCSCAMKIYCIGENR